MKRYSTHLFKKVLIAFCFLFCAFAAHATDRWVSPTATGSGNGSTPADAFTLAQAINYVSTYNSSTDPLNLYFLRGTYNFTSSQLFTFNNKGTYNFMKAAPADDPSPATDPVILNGTSSSTRLLNITASSNSNRKSVTFNQLFIQNFTSTGDADGASSLFSVFAYNELNLNNVTIENIESRRHPLIYLADNSSFSAQATQFNNIRKANSGDNALVRNTNTNSSMSFTGCTFTNWENLRTSDYAHIFENTRTLTFTDCIVDGNTTVSGNRGRYITSTAAISITGTTFKNNSTGGHFIHLEGNSSIFTNNKAVNNTTSSGMDFIRATNAATISFADSIARNKIGGYFINKTLSGGNAGTVISLNNVGVNKNATGRGFIFHAGSTAGNSVTITGSSFTGNTYNSTNAGESDFINLYMYGSNTNTKFTFTDNTVTGNESKATTNGYGDFMEIRNSDITANISLAGQNSIANNRIANGSFVNISAGATVNMTLRNMQVNNNTIGNNFIYKTSNGATNITFTGIDFDKNALGRSFIFHDGGNSGNTISITQSTISDNTYNSTNTGERDFINLYMNGNNAKFTFTGNTVTGNESKANSSTNGNFIKIRHSALAATIEFGDPLVAGKNNIANNNINGHFIHKVDCSSMNIAFRNMRINNNTIGGHFIYTDNSVGKLSVVMSKTSFTENTVTGAFNRPWDNSECTITGSSFVDNHIGLSGADGFIQKRGNCSLKVINNTFVNNYTALANSTTPVTNIIHLDGYDSANTGVLNNTFSQSGSIHGNTNSRPVIWNNLFVGANGSISGNANIIKRNIWNNRWYASGTSTSTTLPGGRPTMDYLLSLTGDPAYFPVRMPSPALDPIFVLDNGGPLTTIPSVFQGYLQRDQIGTQRPVNISIGAIDQAQFYVKDASYVVYYEPDNGLLPDNSYYFLLEEMLDASGLPSVTPANIQYGIVKQPTNGIVVPDVSSRSGKIYFNPRVMPLSSPRQPDAGVVGHPEPMQYSVTIGGVTKTGTIMLDVVNLGAPSGLIGTESIACYEEMQKVKFEPALKYRSTQHRYDGFSVPMVGDLNGDGKPEIVVLGEEYLPGNPADGQADMEVEALFILDGQTGKELVQYSFQGPGGADKDNWFVGAAEYHPSPSHIALVDSDGDGKSEIIVAYGGGWGRSGSAIRRLVSYEVTEYTCQPVTAALPTTDPRRLKVKWGPSERYDKSVGGALEDANSLRKRQPLPQIVNIEGDDNVQVVVYNKIYDAKTGKLLVTLEELQPTANWADRSQTISQYKQYAYIGRNRGTQHSDFNNEVNFSYIYDLDGDGKMEVIAGGKVYYDINIKTGAYKVKSADNAPGSLWGGSGDGLSIGEGYTGVADINGDGVPDIVVASQVHGNDETTRRSTIDLRVWNPGLAEIKPTLALTALWDTLATHSFSFNVDGGMPNPDDKEVRDGNCIFMPLEPTRAGYIFTGWYDGSTLYDFNQPVTTDIHLDARWVSDTIVTHNIFFDPYGGSPYSAGQRIADGNTATQPLVDPVQPDFLFAGWYDLSVSTTLPYNFADPVTASRTLTAQWTPKTKYTVTFDSDGGTPTPAVQNVAQGNKAVAPDGSISKGSDIFLGWYNGNVPYDFNTPVTAPLTLTAKWVAGGTATYLISFSAQGGAPTLSEQTILPNTTVTQPVQPVRAGFVFKGWYKGATQWNFSSAVNASDVADAQTLKSVANKETTPPLLVARELVPVSHSGDLHPDHSYLFIGDLDGKKHSYNGKQIKLPEIALLGRKLYGTGNKLIWHPNSGGTTGAIAGGVNYTYTNPSGRAIEGALVAWTYDLTVTEASDPKKEHRLKPSFLLEHADESMNTGFTFFDFDNDGTQEIVYRDALNLRVISVPTSNPPAVRLNWTTSSHPKVIKLTQEIYSGTGFESPVVADVDGDGSADITVMGHIREDIFNRWAYIYTISAKYGSAKFAPAPRVWNQYMYSPLKINENMQVPRRNLHPLTFAYQTPQDAAGSLTQIYNNTLTQSVKSALFNGILKPVVPVPDLDIINAVLDTVANQLRFTIINTGDAASNAQTPVRIYKGNVNYVPGGLIDTPTAKMKLGVDLFPGEKRDFVYALQSPTDKYLNFTIRAADSTYIRNTPAPPAVIDSFLAKDANGKPRMKLIGGNMKEYSPYFSDCDMTNNVEEVGFFVLRDDAFTVVQGRTQLLDILANDSIPASICTPNMETNMFTFTINGVSTSGSTRGTFGDATTGIFKIVGNRLQYTAPMHYTPGVLELEYTQNCRGYTRSAKIYIYIVQSCYGHFLAQKLQPYQVCLHPYPAATTFNWYVSETARIKMTFPYPKIAPTILFPVVNTSYWVKPIVPAYSGVDFPRAKITIVIPETGPYYLLPNY
ncbi:MAG: InlB B-repeat-containing protein [Bacteroidales bacterium]|nr:InlB B-repeat-containing protein [Bacteroidales bacterium]